VTRLGELSPMGECICNLDSCINYILGNVYFHTKNSHLYRYILERGEENVGIFYGHSEYFVTF
jgi:hypothetical protein